MKKNGNKLQRFFKFVYLKLFRINDSPHKIALGFGIGAFLGIMPGTGPLAALAVAFLFRLNRAAALLGSILTNTWSSIIAFALAVKIGSALLSLDWKKVYDGWAGLLKDFHIKGVFDLSFRDFVLPLLIGYMALGVVLFFLVYLVVMLILSTRGKKAIKEV